MKKGDYVRINRSAHQEWRGKYGIVDSDPEPEDLSGIGPKRVIVKVTGSICDVGSDYLSISMYEDNLDLVTKEEYTIAVVMDS